MMRQDQHVHFGNISLPVYTTPDGQQLLVGVQVANALQRETFNVYRSLKGKGITLVRASPAQVERLVAADVLRPGTHSCTFVPMAEGVEYIQTCVRKGYDLGDPNVGRRERKRRASRRRSASASSSSDDDASAYTPRRRVRQRAPPVPTRGHVKTEPHAYGHSAPHGIVPTSTSSLMHPHTGSVTMHAAAAAALSHQAIAPAAAPAPVPMYASDPSLPMEQPGSLKRMRTACPTQAAATYVSKMQGTAQPVLSPNLSFAAAEALDVLASMSSEHLMSYSDPVVPESEPQRHHPKSERVPSMSSLIPPSSPPSSSSSSAFASAASALMHPASHDGRGTSPPLKDEVSPSTAASCPASLPCLQVTRGTTSTTATITTTTAAGAVKMAPVTDTSSDNHESASFKRNPLLSMSFLLNPITS